jgi:nicotinamide mononucleotide transporter
LDGLPEILRFQLQSLGGLELTAVVLAIAYLVLAIRQNIWCWVCAAISTGIYIFLFVDARLYMESVLNGFYFAMAIYGWFSWRRGSGDEHALPVVCWPLARHVTALAIVVASSSITGWALSTWTDAVYPYIDSMTTFAAIWATFLVARKVLENWWYWLVIDIASLFIYWDRELQLTSMLFLVYVCMIPVGYVSWRRSMNDPAEGA